MAIDYSRWKDIEISDDEDDTHPNIDTVFLLIVYLHKFIFIAFTLPLASQSTS